jgi:hypothetical protein
VKAEALVKKWDLLLEREKEDKHAELLQRLELQHRLIAKNDAAFRLSLKEAEEKRKKELQTQREHQKKMIQDLRVHNQRGESIVFLIPFILSTCVHTYV